MLKRWDNIEQIYHIKVKGMLTRDDLARLSKEIGASLQTLRQPDATRGHTANYWYEVRMRSSKKDQLRTVLMKERHPVEKVKRVALGQLSVEGIPRGRYRLLSEKEVDALRKSVTEKPKAAHR
jgi:23S rRNA pseudouridine2605 synthase